MEKSGYGVYVSILLDTIRRTIFMNIRSDIKQKHLLSNGSFHEFLENVASEDFTGTIYKVYAKHTQYITKIVLDNFYHSMVRRSLITSYLTRHSYNHPEISFFALL